MQKFAPQWYKDFDPTALYAIFRANAILAESAQSTRESLGDISTASAKFCRSKLRCWNGNEGKKPADIVQWNQIDFG